MCVYVCVRERERWEESVGETNCKIIVGERDGYLWETNLTYAH